MAGISPVEYSSWNGCLGLEPTPEMFVGHLVQIFAEVWRVLRPDGTLWVNLGDSFNGSGGAGGDYAEGGLKAGQPKYPGRHIGTLKPKDMLGMPWRLAFALQSFGWYLRMDNIWSKPNPMPESVSDRPGKAHEYMFLFGKSAKYYHDHVAIQEHAVSNHGSGNGFDRPERLSVNQGNSKPWKFTAMRNRRSVWTIGTEPYSGAHFATFPTELVRIPILAGSSPRVCHNCAAPWTRKFTRQLEFSSGSGKSGRDPVGKQGKVQGGGQTGDLRKGPVTYTATTGWKQACRCSHGTEHAPAIVLDPFSGSGTTGQVALEEGRAYVGIEMNPQYVALHRKRIRARQITLEQMASQEEPTSTLAQADLGI